MISSGWDSHIQKYVTTVVRKHFLKNWDHTSATVTPAPQGLPQFCGFRDIDTNKIIDQVPIILQTNSGPKIQYIHRDDPMYDMAQNGETVFLDLSYMGEIQTHIQNIAHWLRIKYPQPRDLSMIPYGEAWKKSAEWRIQLEVEEEKTRKVQLEELKTKALNGCVLLAEGSITVNGIEKTCMLLNLTTKEAIEYEGLRLHHCVGDSFYWNMVKEKREEIWSFRYSLMEPAFTCEIDIDTETSVKVITPCKKVLLQCRGLQNKAPDIDIMEPNLIAKGLKLFDVDLQLFRHWESEENSSVKWNKILQGEKH
jgi:hypothetical protein